MPSFLVISMSYFMRLVAGGRVQPVGPPALVERPVLEQRLVVQEQPVDSSIVFADFDLPHAEVACRPHRPFFRRRRARRRDRTNAADRATTTRRRPRPTRSARPARPSASPTCSAFARGFQANRAAVSARGFDCDRYDAAVDVRHNLERFDPLRRHRFEPCGLPDAGYRRVHDALRLEHLLAPRLVARVGRIRYRDDEFILAFLQCVGDVERKRIVAARVLADFLAVDPHGALPIDGAEVEQAAVRHRSTSARVKLRRYHSRSSGRTGFMTPLSADSTAKGTRISPSHVLGWASAPGRIA